MTEEVQDYTTLMQDLLKLIEACHEIAQSSEEAEIVRTALQALTATDSGLAYLKTHPIIL